MSMDDSARRLVVIDAKRRGAWAVDLADPAKVESSVRLLGHVDANSVATHPQGKWAATGTQHGRGVKIWDLANGQPVKELAHEDWGTKVVFSPDGRWLVTGTPGAFCVWRVEDWERVRVIPRQEALYNAGMAFSPDGRILAMSLSQSAIDLFDMESGEVFAKLSAAELSPIWWVFFSPDGTRLGVSTMSGDVRLWDLRAIRAKLRDVGLDWDLPPYRAATSPAPGDVKPLAVEVRFPKRPATTRSTK
jgi:hypothetical protein